MRSVTATFRNGRVELTESVDWPDGTQVEVRPLVARADLRHNAGPPMTQWPAGFFDRLREQWGSEAFERPPQGENETRKEW